MLKAAKKKKKQSGVKKITSKTKRRFRGTQKQDVVVKERKETSAFEVTLFGEDDVVKRQIPPLGRLSFQAENTAKRP